ncbi:uncharacterized protein LOC132316398 [Cornus florida]|uniref:uncharacterized protein LOC132316398 n=1 Tax=Cornus florida TaxID=4283 RepID=UPI00289A99EE|nr:uncharacterized protein LOC132316398 [Cornus florida]
MQKLGIADRSLKLNSLSVQSQNPSASLSSAAAFWTPSQLFPDSATPVSFSEAPLAKKDKSLDGEVDLMREGSRPEVYTEEHEKLLGSIETLFVDGCDKDGRRIYDQVNGKTCHQRRSEQQRLGLRNHMATEVGFAKSDNQMDNS